MDRYSVLQENERRRLDIFDIPYYNMLKRYLQFLGQDPRQSDGFRKFVVTVMVISIAGIIVPTLLGLYASMCDKDMDAVIECLPHLGAAATSAVKILNIHFNRKNFKKLYELVVTKWEQLKTNNELHILEEITTQGSKMAQMYRNILLSFMALFLFVPLISPTMDVILPLNETRSRQQLLRVNYIFFNDEEYFFYVYLQLFWSALISVVTIVTIDSLYILIIHHNSGLFAVCGYQTQKATKNSYLRANENVSGSYAYEQFRNCVIMHDEAIQFYNILNESSRISYLIQVGLNMIGISATAVQAVSNLDRPEEALRFAVFCGADQFHLFILSLPGQILLDHCAELANNIYCATWYRVPVKTQKMLYMMQIRSKKPCTLSAGGLYEMNMENFGTTFKTCMSYFTMMMSLK